MPAPKEEKLLLQKVVPKPPVQGSLQTSLSMPSPAAGEHTNTRCSLPSPARSPSQAAALSPSQDSHTSSLLDREMTDILCSQPSSQELDQDSITDFPAITSAQPQYSGDPILLVDLLQRELAKATDKLALDIKQDFQELGNRLESIESKVDHTVHRVSQNSNDN